MVVYDYLVVGQVVEMNPAAAVRGPSYSAKKGKTPVLDQDEARQLLDSIDLTTAVGLRDRAVIGLMVYTFARVGAMTGMAVEDYYPQGKRWWIRLHEKGGKLHEIPAHHKLEELLDAYLESTGTWDQKKSPLFRTASGKTGKLTAKRMTRRDVYRMVRRRADKLSLDEVERITNWSEPTHTHRDRPSHPSAPAHPLHRCCPRGSNASDFRMRSQVHGVCYRCPAAISKILRVADGNGAVSISCLDASGGQPSGCGMYWPTRGHEMPPTLKMQDANGGIDSLGTGGKAVQPRANGPRPTTTLKEEFMTEPPPPTLLDEMETPAVVRTMLSRVRNLSSEMRKEYEREFKLSYYYEGLSVAVMSTTCGPAVIASGSGEEVFAVLATIPPSDRHRIALIDPQPLAAIAKELVGVGLEKSRSGR